VIDAETVPPVFVTILTHRVRSMHNMNTNDQIRTVVFDVDGTLFDTLPSLAAAANEVLVLAGFQAVEPQHLRPALSQGITALFQSAIRRQAASVPLALASRLEDAFAHRYASHWLHQAVMYDGALDLLAMLRAQRIAMGICTNRDQDSTRTLLDKAALTGFFDAIVGLGDTEHPKPDAAPLHLALTQLGATPQTALFVGDSGVDAACAQAAGIRLAAHLGGYAAGPDDLRPCTVAFSGYAEFHRWMAARTSTQSTAETNHHV
jgi:phosphoglycolate phosphatase